MKSLRKLLVGVYNLSFSDQKISGITTDSRNVKPGNLFIAYSGINFDGHNFISQAIENGAVAIVGENDITVSKPYFKTNNGRLAWAKIIANWYGNPESKLKFIGITGTDGKTTTSNIIYEILKQTGIKVGLVSTIKAIIDGNSYDTGLHTTSPDPRDLWKFLKIMTDKNVEYAVLEVTSHALIQERFGDINFDICILTNLAHDHLDLHKTIENYKEAKSRLFSKSNMSIINKCCPYYHYFQGMAKKDVLPYSVDKQIRNVQYFTGGKIIFQKFQLKYKNDWIGIKTTLLGKYNLENILAAAKTAEYLGIDKGPVTKGIKNIKKINGRCNFVPNNRGIHLIVDFAHTEQGIKSITTLVHDHLRQKNENIIVVFGCSGERDRSKRALMGKAAMEISDYLIITADDPRKEDLGQIFLEIEQGITAPKGIIGKNYFRVDDRKEAFNYAINKLAQRGDWILFLGKGHEQSINIGGVEYPWDEFKTIKRILKN